METLKMDLFQGKYEKAEERCNHMDLNNIRNMIMIIAYDTESMCVYSFVRYMIEKTRDVFWMKLAADLMIHPLCFVEGAYSVALFHARELLSVERFVENLDRILFFYNIPEKLIDKAEAQCIAREILKIEPNNAVALEVDV